MEYYVDSVQKYLLYMHRVHSLVSTVPGHGRVLHLLKRMEIPEQPIPPRHVRRASCRPTPHGAEQEPYFIHSLHFPTALDKKTKVL